jgi:hypothetical protein
MNDKVSIVRGSLDSVEGGLRKWTNMLHHADDHPRPAQASAIGKSLHQLIRATFNGFEV